MKDLPILYSPILAAANRANFNDDSPQCKTQTRRVSGLQRINSQPNHWVFQKLGYNPLKQCTTAIFQHLSESTIVQLDCPYGRPLDLLWVRENWRLQGWSDSLDKMFIEYQGNNKKWVEAHDPTDDDQWLVDKIESLTVKGFLTPDEETETLIFQKTPPWKPSIHMPKSAAVQWQLIKDIRIERLNNISENDAVQEGIQITDFEPIDSSLLYRDYSISAKELADKYGDPRVDFPVLHNPKHSFQTLIESIHGKEVTELNPFVWVIEYHPLSMTGRPSDEEIELVRLYQSSDKIEGKEAAKC